MNQPNQNNQVKEHHSELEKTYKASNRMGTITIVLIFGLFGLWSVFAQIQMTVTASGKIITKSYNKIVMHPSGGIVKKIFVKEGDFIKKDQPLLEINSAQERAELASNIKKYNTNLFSLCRYENESISATVMECNKYKELILDGYNINKLELMSQNLFKSDSKYLELKLNLLKNQNDVLRSQNDGLNKQIKSNQIILASFEGELVKWEKLLKSDSIDELKILELQRTIEQNYLQIGILDSKIKENIITIKVQTEQIAIEKETFKNTALTNLNDLELENGLIYNTIDSLTNMVENTTIKAPSDGIVTDMKIHAVREVMTSQTQIMSIVPDDKDLIVEAYVSPSDIEKVYTGQLAEISFPAFINPTAIPIEGKITYVSADVITPEGDEESYYVVLLEITPKGFQAIKQNDFNLIPGMQSAAFIQTGKQTLMQYLMQPIIQMFKGIYHAH